MMPSLPAAFTYAVGKVFVQHFASGDTFLDFDPKTVREYFARRFEEGKLVVSKMKTVGFWWYLVTWTMSVHGLRQRVGWGREEGGIRNLNGLETARALKNSQLDCNEAR